MTTIAVVVLVLLLVAVGGLAALEHRVRTVVLERVRAAVEETAAAPTTLTVPHRPLLPHVLRRLVPSATVTFMSLPAGDGRTHIDEVVVDLVGLHLTGPRLRPGLRVDQGTFRAHLSAEAVNVLVSLPPGLARVELHTDRIRLRTVTGVAIDTSVTVARRGLRIEGTGGLLSFLPRAVVTVPWPDLPYGARVERLEPRPRGVDLVGRLDPDSLVFSR